MKENTARILRALFYAYVAFTLVHIAYVVNHEPFAFDAWNVALDTKAKPPTVGNFFAFWHQQYTSSNPRIGQPMAYLAYKIDGVAEVGTPLAYLGIVLAAFVLGVGRWPSRKNDRDLATIAVGIGCLWIASESFPAYMFCRAYATNYVWSIAAQMWFLVPLRLHAAGLLRPPTIPKYVGYGLLGVVAGMGNEHVGPTLIVFALGYAIWTLRKKQRAWLLWVGALGLVVGYALVFFAPGQSQRYEGLAERYTLFEQIIVRGFTGNIGIYLDFLASIAPLMLLMFGAMVIGLIGGKSETDAQFAVEQRERQRETLAFVGLVLLGCSLITMTIFASPKLGPRFFMHAGSFVLAALLGVLQTFLHRKRGWGVFIGFAVIVSVYAAARTIPLYKRMSAASDTRMSELAATTPGGVYTAVAWEPVNETWWALGDDARDQKKDELIARYFGLDRVVFRGSELWKSLGVNDVKLIMDYEFPRPMCIDEIDKLDIQPFIGRDVGAIHHAFLDALAKVEHLGGQRPTSVDLRVSFIGNDPPMPSKKVFVARWRDGNLEGYKARLGRIHRSKERAILIDDALKKDAWDIYLVRIGEEPRLLGKSNAGQQFGYIPWKPGIYWTLACKPEHCFVLMSVWHAI